MPIRPAHTDLVLSMVTDDDASRSLWLDEENDALAPTIRAVQVVFARAVEAGYGADNMSGVARLFD